MEKIRELEVEVRAVFPEATIEVDEPEDSEKGSAWLTARFGNQALVAEWNPKHQAFGVSSLAAHAYGEGPDHVSDTVEEVIEQFMALLAVAA